MASPASKRKRNTASSAIQGETSRPTSRAGPGTDLAQTGSTSAANTRNHKKHASTGTTGDPPSKRARTRSSVASASNVAPPSNDHAVASNTKIEKQEPDEPSSITEDSVKIQEKETHKRRASRSASNIKSNGNIEVVDSRERDPGTEGGRTMKDPPKGKIIHPRGGYKTNPPPEGRPVRVYADGVFDLFHLGHMRQLEQAKTIFPNTYLIVGVTGDAETHRRKGLTVLSGKERAETVRHCKWVDEVIPNCPWIVTTDFLSDHQIDYVAHDDEPYGADEGDDIYSPIKSQGKFLVTQRTEGVSTTGIITKIVKDYEKYIARQFKRGTTRQELNVSWLKKNELDIKRHVGELRDSIKQNWTSAGGEIGKDLRTFWQNAGVPGISRPTSPGPLRLETSGGSAGLGISSSNKSPILEQSRHLEIPGSRPDTPGRMFRSDDFAAGYSLGLVGGIKSWMQARRGRVGHSQNASPQESEEEDALRSPVSEAASEPKKSGFLGSLRSKRSARSLKSQNESVDAMDVRH